MAFAPLAQLAEASSSSGEGCGFESRWGYMENVGQSELTKLIVKNMRDLRKQRGLSAEALSQLVLEKTGIMFSRATIANLEVDRRNEVSVSELMALATVFDVSFEWFVTAHGPRCNWCKDEPPQGYQCMTCLTENPRVLVAQLVRAPDS